jgi:hypothetical protein
VIDDERDADVRSGRPRSRLRPSSPGHALEGATLMSTRSEEEATELVLELGAGAQEVDRPAFPREGAAAQLLEVTRTRILAVRRNWQDFARRELHLSYSRRSRRASRACCRSARSRPAWASAPGPCTSSQRGQTRPRSRLERDPSSARCGRGAGPARWPSRDGEPVLKRREDGEKARGRDALTKSRPGHRVSDPTARGAVRRLVPSVPAVAHARAPRRVPGAARLCKRPRRGARGSNKPRRVPATPEGRTSRSARQLHPRRGYPVWRPY